MLFVDKIKRKLKKAAASRREQTLAEEVANSITHGIGAALSIAALVVLVVYASEKSDAWRIVSFSVYGTSLFMLYLASSLYHGFRNPRIKQVMRIFDHSSIYLLIAGTYTPISLVAMEGAWGWTIFGIVWSAAIIGIVLKAFLFGKFKVLSVVLYLIMGWIIVIAYKPMLEMVPPGLVFWLFAGGLSYTLGVIFYAFGQVRFFHSVWHLFVLGGSASHFVGIFLHLT